MRRTIENQIREFIVENFLFGDSGGGLNDEDSLLEKGIIDSTGVLELVSFLEETYGIKVEDEDLIPENLDSISNVTNYTLSRLGAYPKTISEPDQSLSREGFR